MTNTESERLSGGIAIEEVFTSRPVVKLTVATLLPIIGVVFVAYLVIGLAMPVLPLHVHQRLGLSTFMVGLVVGSQFVAALISRVWAGHYADSRGAKHAVVAGLLIAVVSGVCYFMSLQLVGRPGESVTVLFVGRAMLGVSESMIITGALSWGLAIMGAGNTGKVMSFIGTALYAAFAVGAPVGTSLYSKYGFGAASVAATLIPLVTLLLVIPLRGVRPSGHERPAASRVLGAVWAPGVGVALGKEGQSPGMHP